jgi:hypothetical protein
MPEHTQGTSTTVLGTRRYRSGTSAHGCYAPQPECQPQIFGDLEHSFGGWRGVTQRFRPVSNAHAASTSGRRLGSVPEDEYSIVTEGEIGFRSGDREAVLGPSGYITKPAASCTPRGTPGRFRPG